MEKRKKPLVRDVNPQLLCVLCHGYLIEATTIVECLHSFCRSCLVKYLENNKFCPICDVQLHKNNPLQSVRCDPTLQQLVYKLVPGLYANEMARRRKYYRELGGGGPSSSETDPDPYPVQNLYFSPEDSISLSLEFMSSEDEYDSKGDEATCPEKQSQLHRRYLQCPAAVNVSHLKKFLRMKYDINTSLLVDIIYDGECLVDDFSLIDVAYTFNWNRTSPMRFKYRIRKRSIGSSVKPKKSAIVQPANQKKQTMATIFPQDPKPETPKNEEKKANDDFRVQKMGLVEAEEKNVEEKVVEEKVEVRPVEPKKVVQEKRKIEEPERERKRQRTSEHSAGNNSCMDESHDADDEDDERVVRSPEHPLPDRKEHAKKSDRKEKKKSKKAKHHHHHHHHHRHHDKRKDPPPQAATILHKPGDDVMKLKVKLTAIKTDNSKVTKYSVVEDFEDKRCDDRKESKQVERKEEIKEKKIKDVPKLEMASSKKSESEPPAKSPTVTPPVQPAKPIVVKPLPKVNPQLPKVTSQPPKVAPAPPKAAPPSSPKVVPPPLPKVVPPSSPKVVAVPPSSPVKEKVLMNNKKEERNVINHSPPPTVIPPKKPCLQNNLSPKSNPPSPKIVNNIINNNNNNKIIPNNNHNGSSSPLRNKPEAVKLITGESAKEKLMQMRAVRHKVVPKPEPIKMPPSSITVSKITAEEKRQMERAKMLAAVQASDESRRPSLEIVLVNGPPGKEEQPTAPVPAPTPPVKKNVRPTPPSIPLVRLTKSAVARWQAKPPETPQVLDLSEKSSRKSPDTPMRNLLTLSDTAVQIRNMMQDSELKIPTLGCKPNATTTYAAPPLRNTKPNQNVRHIPNPSALVFRQFNGVPPGLPLTKMESMTRNLEKVAAGLKAAYAAK